MRERYRFMAFGEFFKAFNIANLTSDVDSGAQRQAPKAARQTSR